MDGKTVGWRPMETAPLDGTEVLLAVERRAGVKRCLVGHFMPGGFCIEDHPAINRGWYFWNGCMFDEAARPAGGPPRYTYMLSRLPAQASLLEGGDG